MPGKPKPNKKRLTFFEARDRIAYLNTAYRVQAFGERTDAAGKRFQKDLAEVDTPEPDVELEDAELGEAERQAAVARERLRREGRSL